MKVLINTNYSSYSNTNFRGGIQSSREVLQKAVKNFEKADTFWNADYSKNRDIIENALFEMAKKGKSDAEMAAALGKPGNWYRFITEMKDMFDTASNIRSHYAMEQEHAIRYEQSIYRDMGYSESEIAEVTTDPIAFYRKKFAAM